MRVRERSAASRDLRNRCEFWILVAHGHQHELTNVLQIPESKHRWARSKHRRCGSLVSTNRCEDDWDPTSIVSTCASRSHARYCTNRVPATGCRSRKHRGVVSARSFRTCDVGADGPSRRHSGSRDSGSQAYRRGYEHESGRDVSCGLAWCRRGTSPRVSAAVRVSSRVLVDSSSPRACSLCTGVGFDPRLGVRRCSL